MFEVLAELLDGVDGADENDRYQRMFSQWLQPQPGVTEGNPDETYHIIESLLDVKYSARTRAKQDPHPWHMLDVDAVGTMKVVRVSDAKRGGRDFTAMLQSFLRQTASSRGPAWSGMIEVDTQSSSPRSLPTHRTHWYLFAVIKDFSQDEASKKLQQNIPAWFLQRQLCQIHPVSKASPEVSSVNASDTITIVHIPRWYDSGVCNVSAVLKTLSEQLHDIVRTYSTYKCCFKSELGNKNLQFS